METIDVGSKSFVQTKNGEYTTLQGLIVHGNSKKS